MDWVLRPARALRGDVRVPGDKSVGHRALILGALARGESRVDGLPAGQDVASTGHVLEGLGVAVERRPGAGGPSVIIRGRGMGALGAPAAPLDCGNSGTTMRLMAGVLAGQSFESVLTGDASLRRRPMERVAEPLRCMGASVISREDGRAPLRVRGGRLRGVTYRPPVASAQLKSAVLLAGLYAEGVTVVVEPQCTRDHTERMLRSMGAELELGGSRIGLHPGRELQPLRGRLPGDVSSAAFLLAAACLAPWAELTLRGVGVNPTRRAVLDLLVGWGARIVEEPAPVALGEPVAVLHMDGPGSQLAGGRVTGADVPPLIDELPLLGLLAPFTRLGLEVRDAGELRVKESDRIATTCAAVRALGGQVEEYPDGFAVAGGTGLGGGTVEAAGDHRIALAAAAVSVGAGGPVTVRGAAAAAVSYPGFDDLLRALCRP